MLPLATLLALGLAQPDLREPRPAAVRVVLEPVALVDAALLRDTPARLAKLAGCEAPACKATVSRHSAHVVIAHLHGPEPERMRTALEGFDERRFSEALGLQLVVPPVVSLPPSKQQQPQQSATTQAAPPAASKPTPTPTPTPSALLPEGSPFPELAGLVEDDVDRVEAHLRTLARQALARGEGGDGGSRGGGGGGEVSLLGEPSIIEATASNVGPVAAVASSQQRQRQLELPGVDPCSVVCADPSGSCDGAQDASLPSCQRCAACRASGAVNGAAPPATLNVSSTRVVEFGVVPGSVGRRSLTVSWKIAAPPPGGGGGDDGDEPLFFVLFAAPVADAFTTLETPAEGFNPFHDHEGGAVGHAHPAATNLSDVQGALPWATLAPEHVAWLNRSALAQPLGSFAVTLVPNVSDAASCVDGCTAEVPASAGLVPRTHYALALEAVTSRGASFGAELAVCTAAETEICTADPCCLCDADANTLVCGASLGGADDASADASCDLQVCDDAQYCLCGGDGDIVACAKEGLHRQSVSQSLTTSAPAVPSAALQGLVPAACVPHRLVVCATTPVLGDGGNSAVAALSLVARTDARCYYDDDAARPLRAFAECSDGVALSNIGGEQAASYPPRLAAQADAATFCGAHGGLETTDVATPFPSAVLADDRAKADAAGDVSYYWRVLTCDGTPSAEDAPSEEGVFACVSQEQAEAVSSAAALGAGAAVADALAKLGADASAAELQAAAEGGARAAASAAQSQSCPQPPSPPPGFLALPPPPRRSPPPRRGAFLRRTSTRASLALSSSNRAQSF